MFCLENEKVVNASCLKNSICKIKTNLKIDLNLFLNYFGGQYTKRLPAVRITIMIDKIISGNEHLKNRYSILVYRSGIFIITNFYDFTNMKKILLFFNYFTYFITLKSISKCSDSFIKTEFLIENFHFSINIGPSSHSSIFDLIDNVIRNNVIKDNDSVKYDSKYIEGNTYIFPANIMKIMFKRDNTSIINYKSEASKKRHKKDLFEWQVVSIHIHGNGKIIITGAQTRSDIFNIMCLMREIISGIFKK